MAQLSRQTLFLELLIALQVYPLHCPSKFLLLFPFACVKHDVIKSQDNYLL